MVEPDAFAQVLSYVEKETETLKLLRCKSLKECLLTGQGSRKRDGNIERWRHYKMYLALEKKMSPEQRRVLAEWERTNCVQEAAGLRPAFEKFCSIAEQHVDAMRALRKPALEEVCLSVAARENRVWGQVCRGFALRHRHETFNEQEKEKWKELEERICVDDSPVQQQFDRFMKMLEDNRDELKAMQKSTLLELMRVAGRTGNKEYIFGRNFWRRSYEKLDEDMKAKLQEWEALLCVPPAGSVDKFLQILDRRKAELQSFAAASVESLFAVHAMKGDAELRCCYDFMQRTFPSLTEETKEMVRNALGQLLPASATVPLKKSHEAKLHSRETVLGDNLPRPRLPKSLRQLYGNSADAESRTMAFFHRVNEVDTFLNELEFQDCSYCHEGWFGTKRTKAQLPGKFETQTYQKTNFVQMPKKDWLEPERPICDMCLKEAKKRAQDGLPKEPFRLTAENFADPGDTLPETDALTFFEEELLSPIQHIVRIFTLHATGQCELRGHVGNLFQNGPQYVRQIPAVVGDMKMLLIRRCPKDPNRKHVCQCGPRLHRIRLVLLHAPAMFVNHVSARPLHMRARGGRVCIVSVLPACLPSMFKSSPAMPLLARASAGRACIVSDWCSCHVCQPCFSNAFAHASPWWPCVHRIGAPGMFTKHV